MSITETGNNLGASKIDGVYKELWMAYQNEEMKAIQDLTYDELISRIVKWEEIEFEARAKRQKDLAEKRTRDLKKAQSERDSLIHDPKYTPKDSPTTSPIPYKVKGERLSKQDKLKNSLGDLGVDLGDLLKDIQAKKSKGTKEGMDNQ